MLARRGDQPRPKAAAGRDEPKGRLECLRCGAHVLVGDRPEMGVPYCTVCGCRELRAVDEVPSAPRGLGRRPGER